MTSGQWTIGAATKCSVWRPRASVSPSFTTIRRSSHCLPKKFAIIANALAEETSVAAGKASMNAAMLAEWSGSMCWTTR